MRLRRCGLRCGSVAGAGSRRAVRAVRAALPVGRRCGLRCRSVAGAGSAAGSVAGAGSAGAEHRRLGRRCRLGRCHGLAGAVAPPVSPKTSACSAGVAPPLPPSPSGSAARVAVVASPLTVWLPVGMVRVRRGAVRADLEVHVRAGAAAGAADLADLLAGLHVLVHGHVALRQVGVTGRRLARVADADHLPVAALGAGNAHGSAVRGANGRASRRRDVGAAVRVVAAVLAELAGDGAAADQRDDAPVGAAAVAARQTAPPLRAGLGAGTGAAAGADRRRRWRPAPNRTTRARSRRVHGIGVVVVKTTFEAKAGPRLRVETPVTARPWARWNAFTAPSVIGPKMPSLATCSSSWTAAPPHRCRRRTAARSSRRSPRRARDLRLASLPARRVADAAVSGPSTGEARMAAPAASVAPFWRGALRRTARLRSAAGATGARAFPQHGGADRARLAGTDPARMDVSPHLVLPSFFACLRGELTGSRGEAALRRSMTAIRPCDHLRPLGSPGPRPGRAQVRPDGT